jgi:hypothetical protein
MFLRPEKIVLFQGEAAATAQPLPLFGGVCRLQPAGREPAPFHLSIKIVILSVYMTEITDYNF